jgi:integrase
VFCNIEGKPLDNKNFSDRVWYPLLRHLGLERRRPYQTRHTAATLWLASGEAPAWIAMQLGHSDQQMLFKVYARYVPNLTRQDGSAMERLLAAKLSHGPLATVEEAGGAVMIPVDPLHSDAMRQPIPRPGNWKKSDVHWSREDAAIAEAKAEALAEAHKQAKTAVAKSPAANNFNTPEATDPKAASQAPPLSWEDMARNWLQDEFDPATQASETPEA